MRDRLDAKKSAECPQLYFAKGGVEDRDPQWERRGNGWFELYHRSVRDCNAAEGREMPVRACAGREVVGKRVPKGLFCVSIGVQAVMSGCGCQVFERTAFDVIEGVGNVLCALSRKALEHGQEVVGASERECDVIWFNSSCTVKRDGDVERSADGVERKQGRISWEENVSDEDGELRRAVGRIRDNGARVLIRCCANACEDMHDEKLAYGEKGCVLDGNAMWASETRKRRKIGGE
jgi:hypothetical protein